MEPENEVRLRWSLGTRLESSNISSACLVAMPTNLGSSQFLESGHLWFRDDATQNINFGVWECDFHFGWSQNETWIVLVGVVETFKFTVVLGRLCV